MKINKYLVLLNTFIVVNLLFIVDCQVPAYNNYDPWLGVNHDSSFSSFSQNMPILNNITWSNINININSNSDNYCNNTILNFNPVILPDQSFIILKINNNNSNLQIIKYKFNEEIDWLYNFNEYNCNNNINANIVIASTIVINSNNIKTPPTLVYIKQFSKFYLLNTNDGSLLWNSTISSEYSNCTSINYFSEQTKIASFYSICQSNIIIINPYDNNGVTINSKSLSTIVTNNNSQQLQNTTFTNNGILFGYSSYYIEIFNIYLMVYVNFNIGLVSLLYSNFQIFAQYKLKNNTINQLSPVVINYYGTRHPFLITLSCNNNKVSIDNYGFSNGTLLYSTVLVSNVNCNLLSNTKLTSTPSASVSSTYISIGVVFMFNYPSNDNSWLTYSGSYLPAGGKNGRPKIVWYLNGDSSHTLDLAITQSNSIYYCRNNHLFIKNQGNTNDLTFYFPNNTVVGNSSGDNNDVCRIAVGESSVLLSLIDYTTSDNDEETIDSFIIRGIDSVCPELCNYGMACMAGGCECLPNYYPIGNCSKYCLSSYDCNGHGTCNEFGLCICDNTTGWYGDYCQSCKSEYGGNNCNTILDKKKALTWVVVGLLLTSSICFFSILSFKLGKMNRENGNFCCECWYNLKFKLFGIKKPYSALDEINRTSNTIIINSSGNINSNRNNDSDSDSDSDLFSINQQKSPLINGDSGSGKNQYFNENLQL